MFTLHEATQRRVCRVSFLVLCVVPTLVTLAGIAYCNRPWRHQDWQNTLASSLHLRAEVADVSQPVPGKKVLTRLRLAGLHSGAELGSIDRLTMRRDDGRLLLDADVLQLQASELSNLATALKTWLSTDRAGELAFHADELTIVSPQRSELQLVDLSVRSASGGRVFRITARDLSGNTLKVDIKADDEGVRGIIDAQQAAVPAWLIGELVPGIGGCESASFTGLLDVENSIVDQHGKLTGALSQVDTQQWGGTAPHQLQGLANIQLEQVVWKNGRLELARGSIAIDGGSATYSLLLDMQKKLLCTTGPALQQPRASGEWVPFDELMVRFNLSQRGLVIAGDESGHLVIRDSEPLVIAPPANTLLPTAQIVQLFHQFTRKVGWMPATKAAHEMADELPLPDEEEVEENR